METPWTNTLEHIPTDINPGSYTTGDKRPENIARSYPDDPTQDIQNKVQPKSEIYHISIWLIVDVQQFLARNVLVTLALKTEIVGDNTLGDLHSN